MEGRMARASRIAAAGASETSKSGALTVNSGNSAPILVEDSVRYLVLEHSAMTSSRIFSLFGDRQACRQKTLTPIRTLVSMGWAWAVIAKVRHRAFHFHQPQVLDRKSTSMVIIV